MEDGESEDRCTHPIFTDDNEQSVEYNLHNTRAHTPTLSWSVKAESTDKGNEGREDYPRISTPIPITMNKECVKCELGYHGMDHPFYSVPPPTPLLSPKRLITEPDIDLPAYTRPYPSPAQIGAQDPGPVPPSADATMTPEEARSTVEPRISASQRGGPSSDKVYCLSRLHDHLILHHVCDFDQLYPRFNKSEGPEECDNITSEHSKSVRVVADNSNEAIELFRDHWNPSSYWRWLVMEGMAEDCAGRPTDPVANALDSGDE